MQAAIEALRRELGDIRTAIRDKAEHHKNCVRNHGEQAQRTKQVKGLLDDLEAAKTEFIDALEVLRKAKNEQL